jgi:hypothetical protein
MKPSGLTNYLTICFNSWGGTDEETFVGAVFLLFIKALPSAVILNGNPYFTGWSMGAGVKYSEIFSPRSVLILGVNDVWILGCLEVITEKLES